MDEQNQLETISEGDLCERRSKITLEIMLGTILVGAGCFFAGKNSSSEVNSIIEVCKDAAPYFIIAAGGALCIKGMIDSTKTISQIYHQMRNYLNYHENSEN